MIRQILADEGVSGYLVRELRKDFEIEWILEGDSALTDREIMKISKSNSKILITEDKDFGEWYFHMG
jgi:predicted nuclease of predicted toxin-antitoxin system